MSSESRPSEAAVNPTRSTKSTETRRRSAAAGSCVAAATGAAAATPSSFVPHSPQNLTPGAFGVPHDGHAAARLAPHSPQNLRPSSLAA